LKKFLLLHQTHEQLNMFLVNLDEIIYE